MHQTCASEERTYDKENSNLPGSVGFGRIIPSNVCELVKGITMHMHITNKVGSAFIDEDHHYSRANLHFFIFLFFRV
jgi:hypothetical protein